MSEPPLTQDLLQQYVGGQVEHRHGHFDPLEKGEVRSVTLIGGKIPKVRVKLAWMAYHKAGWHAGTKEEYEIPVEAHMLFSGNRLFLHGPTKKLGMPHELVLSLPEDIMLARVDVVGLPPLDT